jgi:hypothetical protein
MKTLHSLCIAALAVTRVAAAQDPMPGVDLPTDAKSTLATRARGPVAIPVVTSGPTLGSAFGGVAAYVFRVDSQSAPSALGVGAVYSTTQSWMFAAGSRVYYKGRWNAGGGLAFFDVHYDFFGVGTAAGRADQTIPIIQNGDAEVLELLRRIPKLMQLELGPRYLHRGVTTTLDGDDITGSLANLAMTADDYNISALGANAAYDTRDDLFMPRHGAFGELAGMMSRYGLGSDFSYDFYRGALNQYVALPAGSVFAMRLSMCGVGHDAPIWEMCMYGVRSDLRGYEGGRYRDRAMFATQGELRRPLGSRVVVALFGGIGGVGRSLSNISGDALLPAGGGGLRYVISQEYHMKIGVDYAWGRDGGAFYLRMGEAF